MALKTGKNVIFNAFVYYVKLKTPALRYGLKPVAGSNHGNREYTVDVLVTAEDLKALKKKYKTVKSLKDAKEFDAKEFEAQYKVAPPYEAEEYFVVKFKKSADYKDGNATPKPLVKAAKGCGVPVTIETDIGNGTQAHVQFKEREWTYEGKKGLSLDLAAVGVVDLVVFQSAGVEAEFEFEDDFEDEMDEGSTGTDDAPFEKDNTPADDGW